MPLYLSVSDQFPTPDASGVYINDIVWAQFSEPLNPNSVTYYTFTVNERDTYDVVDGTVHLQGVSGNYDNSIIIFTPTNGFNRNTNYTVLATTSIKSADGQRYLDHDTTWYFRTGNTAASGNIGDDIYDLDPSGFTVATPTGYAPTSSGAIADPLNVVSTNPINYGTNKSLSIQHIAIEFDDVIPSGIDLYDHLTITSKHVLG